MKQNDNYPLARHSKFHFYHNATALPFARVGGAHFIIFKSGLDGGVQNLFCAPAVSRQAMKRPLLARQLSWL
ncbi:TPA: hypothetical protein PXJ37_004525 [Yersinia enterocolitica]|jgi:hypothetical protein|uniref:hypothetical protein n=1 Tax=Enterobacterales TaxID=91347 RepID=UPI0012D3772E|nr:MULTISPECIES: hypothetical protein [Enterobacterales]EKN3717971.1 hypothetical protein [Yersinia enterocolitica]HDY9346284.1 hypothetical protein [Klebsiella pneumoniae]EKN3734896.1 hypothetical protein [Yersinia enterocolitica]MCB5315529.1 hypothetical protein [Yersinia intermedia]MCB5329637.1 hypothetical protein [Yersinia intermedia]